MTAFATAGHLASRVGQCPGNDQSADKRRSGRTRQGSKNLNIALKDAAMAATPTNGSYLQALYRRKRSALGHGRALGAVKHSIICACRHTLSTGETYTGYGPGVPTIAIWRPGRPGGRVNAPIAGVSSAEPWRAGRPAVALAVLALLVITGAANVLVGFGGSTVESLISRWAASLGYVLAAAIVVRRGSPAAPGVGAAGDRAVAVRDRQHRVEGLVRPAARAADPLDQRRAVAVAVPRELRRTRTAGPRQRPADPARGVARRYRRRPRLSALGTTIVFGPVLASATGNWSAVVTNLAYPVADLLLAALVVGLPALRGWRLDRGWALLGSGFMLLYVAETASTCCAWRTGARR